MLLLPPSHKTVPLSGYYIKSQIVEPLYCCNTEEGQRPETRLTKPVLCGIVLSAERALSQVVSCSFLNCNESPNGPVYSFQIIIIIIIIMIIIIIIIMKEANHAGRYIPKIILTLHPLVQSRIRTYGGSA